MDDSAVKMVYRPQDENDNPVEIQMVKNEQINRRFNFARKKFLFEIAFYCMTLVAIFFLFLLIYQTIDGTIKVKKCPTVTILKSKHPSEFNLTKRVQIDESDPLFALCGPCPRVVCPRCIVTDDNCTCPDPSQFYEPCPTITTAPCPPCPTPSSITCRKSSSTSTTTEVPTYTYTEEYRTDHLCLSRNCVIEAANILHVMDVDSINCTQLTRNICSKQISMKKNKLPSEFDWFKTGPESGMSVILSEVIKNQGRGNSILKDINDFHWSCIDEYLIERNGHKPLKDLVNAIGGWPLLDQDDECSNNFNLTKILTTIRTLGAFDSSLFTADIILTSNMSTDPIISISYPTLAQKDLANYNNKYAELYYELMADTAIKFGADRQKSSSDVREILNFESEIAKFIEDDSEAVNDNLTITEMTSLFPNIEWTQFLKGYIYENITGEEKIHVKNVDFIRLVSSLIKSTEKRTICNYMIWRVVLDLMPRLNRNWREAYYDKMDVSETRTHRQFCDQQVIEYFYNVLPILYVRENLHILETIQFKKIMKNSVDYSLGVLSNFLNSNQSANEAGERLKSFGNYADEIYRFINSSIINEMHKKIDLKEEDYFLNILELNKFFRKIQIEALKCKDPYIVNYVGPGVSKSTRQRFFAEQLLIILAMVTTKPFITDLNYLNYSSIGLRLVYHFLNFLFKPTFITNGVDNELIEMKEIELNNVEIKSNCIIADDYLYGSADKKNLTFDYLAILITEKAFLSDNKQSDLNYDLPGFNFEANQLFFINMAKTFCSIDLNNLDNKPINAINATADRLSAALWMLRSFQRSFQCSQNSKYTCFNKN